MANSEFIRKIDTMGRIVIPKDLRDQLGILPDDSIKLILNNNHIELTKFLLDNKSNKINQIINNTSRLIDGKVYFLNNIDFKPFDNKEYYSDNYEDHLINNNMESGYFAIVPLINGTILIGFIIIIKNEKITNYDRFYIDIIKCLVENNCLL